MFDKYDVVKSEQVKLGRFKVVLDTVKKDLYEYPYSFMDVKNSVAILARHGDRFIFIKQYRHTIKDVALEIPGGAIDEGETPETAAKRELLEETGYRTEKIVQIGTYYPTIGISNEKCHLFFAECGIKEKKSLEPLENILIVLLSEQEIESVIKDGQLKHGMALVAWLKFKGGIENVNRNIETEFYQ